MFCSSFMGSEESSAFTNISCSNRSPVNICRVFSFKKVKKETFGYSVKILILCVPSMIKCCLSKVTSPLNFPWTVSYLNKYAMYSGSRNGSFAPTTSTSSFASRHALNTSLPIRPNPLILNGSLRKNLNLPNFNNHVFCLFFL
jgi:hypothetical protein